MHRTNKATVSGPSLTVDLAALARNTRKFAALTPHLCAVVKANAFGLGVQAISETVTQHGAAALGVTSLAEAAELRELGVTAPLLSWLNYPGTDYRLAANAGIDVAVTSPQQLSQVRGAAQQTKRTIRVHLFVDVGMNREAASPDDWPELFSLTRAAIADGSLALAGIMGHLPDGAHPYGDVHRRSRGLFAVATRASRKAGLPLTRYHLAATAGALYDPQSLHSGLRVGAGLYGINPGARIQARQHDLPSFVPEPIARLTAPVTNIRFLEAGQGVGYGHEFITAGATRLALLPIGYADGVPARLSPQAAVSIGNRRFPIVGRVSMDQIVVDVTSGDVAVGDTAVIFGTHGTEPRLEEWAEWADTIEHQLLTGIGSRVLRYYSRNSMPEPTPEKLPLVSRRARHLYLV